jgi:hypothetical protein
MDDAATSHLYRLAFGIGVADEGFATIRALAERIHVLRAGRTLILRPATVERCDGQPSGQGVSVRIGTELLAYALFAVPGKAQQRLEKALQLTGAAEAA